MDYSCFSEIKNNTDRLFSADHENFTETDPDVSAAQANPMGGWENSSDCAQFLAWFFGSARAKPQRTISFLLSFGTARRSLVKSQGGNIWIQTGRRQSKSW